MRTAADGDRPTTLQHVAALAGVSPKTASRALNGEPLVAPGTAARVVAAAQSVGYRVNATARDLRLGAAPPLVGLVTADLADPFASRLAAGLERELRTAGLLLVTVSSGEDPEGERAAVATLLQRGVRALVVVCTAASPEHLGAARRPGTPLVTVGGGTADADRVVLDHRAGARAATEHLIARSGGRPPRLALLGDPRRAGTSRACAAGVRDALDAAGLAPLAAEQVREAHDAASAGAAVAELLAAHPAPTGLLATSAALATGAVRGLVRGGALGRCAVAGVGDVDLAGLVDLAVVSYDAEETGRTAGRLVLERVQGDGRPARRVVIPARLVVTSRGGVPEAPEVTIA